MIGVLLSKMHMQEIVLDELHHFILGISLPCYRYMIEDAPQEDFIPTGFINHIYPINEYLLSNESYGEQDEFPLYMNKTIATGNYIEPTEKTADNNDIMQTEYTAMQTDESSVNRQVVAAETTAHTQNISEGIIHRQERTGTLYTKQQLSDYQFTHDKFYTITSITSLTPEIFRPSEFLDYDMRVSKDDPTKPQILIFHTHSQEAFADSVEGDVDTTIVGVGNYLTQLLTEQYGYSVFHDTSVYDYVDGKLDRSKAYTYAEEGIAKILEENPSIQVVIDLHRDGVADTTHLVTNVDGKEMAQVMLFNGLSYSNLKGNIGYLYNPYRDENLAMSLQLRLLGDAYYPGFLRRNYINAYRYCLHERGKSMLIEAGAQTNTVQEEKNAMEPLADILDKLLQGEKAYE